MNKKLICIECPRGCALSVDIENCRVIKVEWNQCPKGARYAAAEIERPVRILTSTVSAVGLSIKMVPVRTDQPIPKGKLVEAMEAVRRVRLERPVAAGDSIVANLLGTGANLIATRSVGYE